MASIEGTVQITFVSDYDVKLNNDYEINKKNNCSIGVKSKHFKKGVKVTEESMSSDESTCEDVEEPVIKARVLVSAESTSQNLFGFKTPKRREALVKAAQESVHSVKRSRRPVDKECSSTLLGSKKCQPEKQKCLIQSIALAGNQHGSSDEESSNESSCMSNDEDDNNKDINDKSMNGNEKDNKNHELLDEYFQVHHTKHQSLTSDKTLAKLSNPKMNKEELVSHLEEVQSTHINHTTHLHKELLQCFDRWMFKLLSGFNLVLYGLGSKHTILERFRKHFTRNILHIVINGFFPNITIKQILNLITEEVMEKDVTFKTVLEHGSFIKKEFDKENASKLFLIIHNIDGQMLRSYQTQVVLSNLSSASNIHVIASTDHINAPLLWDQNINNRFNWIWQDSTTFEPYIEETSYENSLLVQQSGSLVLSSLIHVLGSLTPNAKGIFKLLIKHMIDNNQNSNYQGLPFADLYTRCREQFLVSSDTNLKAQLTEFRDHKLIKIKKGHDGIEYLSIAVEYGTIKQYIENDGA